MKRTKSLLKELLEDVCKNYGDKHFTSIDIYNKMNETLKKNRGKRHYTLSYPQVKQILARSDFVKKIEDDDDSKKKHPLIYQYLPTEERKCN